MHCALALLCCVHEASHKVHSNKVHLHLQRRKKERKIERKKQNQEMEEERRDEGREQKSG